MVIKGTTNYAAIAERPRPVAVAGQLWKGSRKTNDRRQAGRDLEGLFRLESNDAVFRHAVLKYVEGAKLYKTPNAKPNYEAKFEEDIVIPRLNIFLPFDNIDDPNALSSWHSEMISYEKGDYRWGCDRERISNVRILCKNAFNNWSAQYLDPNKGVPTGNNIRVPKLPRDLGCPVAGKPLSFPCPHECSANGTLYFCIKEMQQSYTVPEYTLVALKTSSKEDIGSIPRKLWEIKEQYGSISYFEVPGFRERIYYVLYRVADGQNRPDGQGGSKRKTHWEVRLDIHPSTTKRIQTIIEITQKRQLGYCPHPAWLERFQSGIVDDGIAWIGGEPPAIEVNSSPVTLELPESDRVGTSLKMLAAQEEAEGNFIDPTPEPVKPNIPMTKPADLSPEEREKWVGKIKWLQGEISKLRPLDLHENPGDEYLESADRKTLITLGRGLKQSLEVEGDRDTIIADICKLQEVINEYQALQPDEDPKDWRQFPTPKLIELRSRLHDTATNLNS